MQLPTQCEFSRHVTLTSATRHPFTTAWNDLLLACYDRGRIVGNRMTLVASNLNVFLQAYVMRTVQFTDFSRMRARTSALLALKQRLSSTNRALFCPFSVHQCHLRGIGSSLPVQDKVIASATSTVSSNPFSAL